MATPPYSWSFEWEPKKAASNRAKHRIAFEQACTIFRDPAAVTIYDEEHEAEEERWITIGRSESGAHLVVIHTHRELGPDEGVIRIISARPATKRELKDYEAAGK